MRRLDGQPLSVRCFFAAGCMLACARDEVRCVDVRRGVAGVERGASARASDREAHDTPAQVQRQIDADMTPCERARVLSRVDEGHAA
jgi:hypothetical protein